MPLELEEPKFDRSFEEIYRELRERIPRYNPRWTNYNDSDPGITLLQLFAWLAEMTLHRMGDVPRKNYLRFAKLLGLQLKPALPAAVRLTFTAKTTEKPATIPARAKFAAQVDGRPVVFETTRALDVIAAPLDSVLVFADGTITKIDSDPGAAPTPFYPLGRNPEVGNALYLGFKPNPNTRQPFPARLTFLALKPAIDTDGVAQRVGEQDMDLRPPVDLVWEYRPKASQDVWERLKVFDDQSVAFTRDGYVSVEGPGEIEPSTDPLVGSRVPEKRYWLRIRLDQNAYPEALTPRLEHFLPDSVDAINLVSEEERFLGTSNGRGEQQLDFPQRPVDPESLELEVRVSGRSESWMRTDDLFMPDETGNGPNRRQDGKRFVLDATAGRIRFGDGQFGDIPPAGAEIVARRWRHGGGALGNRVGAGAVKTLVTQVAGVEKVRNVRAATGGADEESLEEFSKLAPGKLRSRERAVTAQDFETLALSIDGVRQARALAGYHPDVPDVEVPGAVTVVIVADSTRRPPAPSAELIRSVCRRLDRQRLITTEVYVAAPRFLEVRVEARLIAAPEAAFDQVSLEAVERLDAFLEPGTWQFGTNVSPAALYRELFGPAQGGLIRSVEDLRIYVDGLLHGVGRPIEVPSNAVVYPGPHLIVVRPDTQERSRR